MTFPDWEWRGTGWGWGQESEKGLVHPGTRCWLGSAAATAAKSLQSCPTLCDPIDGSPPGSTIPGILQARTLEWVFFSSAWKWKVKVKSLSRVRLLGTPRTAVYQAPPSMGFFRQEYWSGLSLPSPMHKSENESEVAQSCPTLRDPMDYSLPGSSVHGIFQARVLEWVAIAFSNIYPQRCTDKGNIRARLKQQNIHTNANKKKG